MYPFSRMIPKWKCVVKYANLHQLCFRSKYGQETFISGESTDNLVYFSGQSKDRRHMFQKVQTTLYTFPGQSKDRRHSFLLKPELQVRFEGTCPMSTWGMVYPVVETLPRVTMDHKAPGSLLRSRLSRPGSIWVTKWVNGRNRTYSISKG